jgi:hypothetical protein
MQKWLVFGISAVSMSGMVVAMSATVAGSRILRCAQSDRRYFGDLRFTPDDNLATRAPRLPRSAAGRALHLAAVAILKRREARGCAPLAIMRRFLPLLLLLAAGLACAPGSRVGRDIIEVPLPTPKAALPGGLPARPASVAAYGDTIARFLSADPANRGRLNELLVQWQAAGGAPGKPGPLSEADLDGDGKPELVLMLTQRVGEGVSHGTLFILRAADSGYQVAYAYPPVGENLAAFSEPQVEAIDDLNRDGKVKIVFSAAICGSECLRTVQALQWELDGFRTLVSTPFYLAEGKVSLGDPTRAKRTDLLLAGRIGRSRPDGLTREQTVVYAWRDNQYRPAEVIAQDSPYLYFRVLDASYALERGDYARAADLYRRALADPGAKLYLGEKQGEAAGQKERRELDAFARFRLTLALLLAGDKAGAEAAAGDSGLKDAGTAFGPVTTLFWSTARASDAATGCAQVRRYLAAGPTALDVLNGYGVASPVYAADDVCPVK